MASLPSHQESAGRIYSANMTRATERRLKENSGTRKYRQLMSTTADAWSIDASDDEEEDEMSVHVDFATSSMKMDRQRRQKQLKATETKTPEVQPTAAVAKASMQRSEHTVETVHQEHNIRAQMFGKDHPSLLSSKISTSRNSLDMNVKATRFEKFRRVLSASNVDMRELRKLSWNGIPDELRPMAWQLLMGYLPCNSERREQTLARKRKEYADCVAQAFARGEAGLDQTVWHQIRIDVPRTHPHVALYKQTITQEALERILYCWAIRHPASGYVQGINDLLTPFFQTFLSSYVDTRPEEFDMSKLPKDILTVIEADSFWCMTKLLDGIQDNYTHGQPGIQRQINRLRELIYRIDAPLAQHLEREGVEYIQFSFRWMNCLLMREISIHNIVRMWDTYLAEEADGFSDFHVYVCAAFLVKWSKILREMDFQGIITFLQSVPTENWTYRDIEILLSEAFMWKTLFHNAPGHLASR